MKASNQPSIPSKSEINDYDFQIENKKFIAV